MRALGDVAMADLKNFLRFLAAPRETQRSYIRPGARVYAYEGRESFWRAKEGLGLLLMLGEEWVAEEGGVFAARSKNPDETQTVLFYISSLVRFVVESGENMLSIMEAENEHESLYYPSGVWQILRYFARMALAQVGEPIDAPRATFEEAFLSQVRLVGTD